jgi:NitT/TauT family transport system substrate-binding protein
MRRFLHPVSLLILKYFIFSAVLANAEEPRKIRVGYFPNITHAQAVIGLAKGNFKKELGELVTIEPKIFNAGPSVVEALFAKEIDLAYVGPNPAINAYIRSKGAAAVVIAGGASGGARLIVRDDLTFKTPQDFANKKLATPQLGNTQDVAARKWLLQNNLAPKEKGGTVTVLPIKNADQLTLFMRKEIDASWAVEPWATRLIKEGKGREYLDERNLWPKKHFATALVLVSKEFLKREPELVRQWISAHIDLTEWINKNPAEAKALLNDEIGKITGKPLPKDIFDEAFERFEVTYDPIQSSVVAMATSAFDLGFLGREKPNINGLFDLTTINKELADRKKPAIP